jgi:cysteine-rich repeat protein
LKTLLPILLVGALALQASAADVPLSGPPITDFGGDVRVGVITAGVGLRTQPATLSVSIPEDKLAVVSFLYVTGRGSGDGRITLNGVAQDMPLVARAGPLPFDAAQFAETRRIALGPLAPGTHTFTIDGYDQRVPGGAYVVVVVTDADAPVGGVKILEGSDYAWRGFPSPFGPNTETAAFTFAPSIERRTARLILFLHDMQADRSDAVWVMAAASATTPIFDTIVGSELAERVERNRLGVPVRDGGFSLGSELDRFATDVAIPAGADYLAFQVESPKARSGVTGDSLVLSTAILVLPTAGGDGGGGGTTSTTLGGGGGGTTSTTLDGGGGGTTSTTLRGGGGGSSTSTTTPGGGGGGSSTSTTLPGALPPNCGDGVLNLDEECDDGNRADGDGCDATCGTEDTAETWELSLRVRKNDVERLDYLTLLLDVPSALLGSAPVHITLSSRGFQMLEAELPASAFRVKPHPTLAQPDARVAKAKGKFGIWHIKLVLTPVTGIRAYNAKLFVRGEMLPDMFKILYLTSEIRIGDVVYTATDRIRANRDGRFLRYIHPVLTE